MVRIMPNRYTDQRKNRTEGAKFNAINVCEVVASAPNARHIVICDNRGDEEAPFPATVAMPARGDINPPLVGDIVLVVRAVNDAAFVIGTVYAEQDPILKYNDGDRRVGNGTSISYFEIQDDGTIEIYSAGQTTITIDPDGNIRADTNEGAVLRMEGDTVIIEAAGTVELAGTGGNAVARVGDSVNVGGTSGTITSGSNNVNAN